MVQQEKCMFVLPVLDPEKWNAHKENDGCQGDLDTLFFYFNFYINQLQNRL